MVEARTTFTNETIISHNTIQMALESCGMFSESRTKCEAMIEAIDEDIIMSYLGIFKSTDIAFSFHNALGKIHFVLTAFGELKNIITIE